MSRIPITTRSNGYCLIIKPIFFMKISPIISPSRYAYLKICSTHFPFPSGNSVLITLNLFFQNDLKFRKKLDKTCKTARYFFYVSNFYRRGRRVSQRGVSTSKKCQGFMLPRMKNLPLLKRGIGNRASSEGNSLPGGGISTPDALTITCFRRNQLRLLGMGFGASCLPGRGEFVRNFGKGPGGANIVKLFHYCFYLEKRTVRVEQI